MTIRRNTKSKGPQVTVPAGRKNDEPLPGNASFARRVKKTRRRASQSAPANPSATATNAPKHKQPTTLTREERLAAARGAKTGTPSTPTQPTAADTAPAPKPTASSAQPRQKRATTKPPQPRPQREPDAGFVAVGRIQAPHGLKGELKVLSMTENPERFRPKAKLWAGQQPVTVSATRDAGGFVYLTLKGFSSRSSVEKFRNLLLQIPESELPELDEGEYYRFQLIGLQVVDRTGAELGTVAEVIETGATDVYRVTAPDTQDLLLAATPDVVLEIDLEAKRMTVDPPDWR